MFEKISNALDNREMIDDETINKLGILIDKIELRVLYIKKIFISLHHSYDRYHYVEYDCIYNNKIYFIIGEDDDEQFNLGLDIKVLFMNRNKLCHYISDFVYNDRKRRQLEYEKKQEKLAQDHIDREKKKLKELLQKYGDDIKFELKETFNG